MGRSLDNALLNLGLKDKYKDGTDKLGFNYEDLLDCERDAGLGNGGLGRLAACYLDSSATTQLPVWGYGLRYKYGIFQQLIAPDGSQFEAPDPWLSAGYNAWEVVRPDVSYDVRFYGNAERTSNGRAVWVRFLITHFIFRQFKILESLEDKKLLQLPTMFQFRVTRLELPIV